ncbi:NADP-dependent malic enzyme 4 [Vigna angularis]|uniref:NADP-dependent malic enzyme 4 n=1 Tax=Phaseolus angularis TaxID=3914 RepID=A0A8T0KHJ9_PHAAN|nr:NADP-dependent malic enzyme 4 [Vigna angularis]
MFFNRGKIREVLRNWPEKNIQVIVVTDGERILGLGDLGCQCLPITIDVGTNNEKLLNDELYIGLKQRRATGQEYAELMHEFMTALKQTYGEKVLIQGTTSVVLAGLVAALKLVGGNLTDHRFLFLGAGEAGIGIAELIALETSKQTNAPLEEVHKNIWLVDSKKHLAPTCRAAPLPLLPRLALLDLLFAISFFVALVFSLNLAFPLPLRSIRFKSPSAVIARPAS